MTRFADPDEKPLVPRDLKGTITILAIDDSPVVIEILAQGLEAYGHKVLTAPSGGQGLEIFEQKAVDVVLCDLAMPGMSGWDVGRAIRVACGEKRVRKCPFILVTGCRCRVSDDNRIVESGVDAVVEKPVEFDGLLEVIGEVLGKRIPGPKVEGTQRSQ